MFVYVAEFEDRPGLIKIGVAVNVKSRMSSLSKVHGRLARVRKFNMGEERYNVEAHLHKKYAGYNKRLTENCDGYTEFFSDSVKDEVEILLKDIAAGVTDVPRLRASRVARQQCEPEPLTYAMQERLSLLHRVGIKNERDKQLKLERNRVQEFLIRTLRLRRTAYESFVLLGQAPELAAANIMLDAGANIEHLLEPIANRYGITKWRAMVVIAAAGFKTERVLKANNDYIASICVHSHEEELRVRMLEDDNEVTTEFIESLKTDEVQYEGDTRGYKYKDEWFRREGMQSAMVAARERLTPKMSRMDFEKSLSAERLEVCRLALERLNSKRDRAAKFIKRAILGKVRFGQKLYEHFSCIHYYGLHALAGAVSMGVCEDAVLEPFISVAKSQHNLRLTRWRAKVMLRTLNDDTGQGSRDYYNRVQTGSEHEEFYLALAENGPVDESTLAGVLAQGEEYKLRENRWARTDYLCEGVRRILTLREGQILRQKLEITI